MVDRLQNSAALVASFAAGAKAEGGAVESLRAPAATSAQIFDLVCRQMRKLAGSREVDELTQAAAEQAIRSLHTFEGRSALSTWTFRICYLTLRKHDRWYRRWLRRFTLTHDGELPETAMDGSAPDDRLVQSERVARVRAALARISAKQRTVVILHDLEGLEMSAIADVVGALVPAVRSRLRDGRKALARVLADDPYFGVRACSREEEGQ
jgi:RNA polymerase sigma-70 factor (ECF subfamily)